jgi:N-formylglutamate deformylase
MNEATREPNDGFAALQRCIEATIGAVAAHVRLQLGRE